MWIKWGEMIYHVQGNFKMFKNTAHQGMACVSIQSLSGSVDNRPIDIITNYPQLVMDEIWGAIVANAEYCIIDEDKLQSKSAAMVGENIDTVMGEGKCDSINVDESQGKEGC